jgi:hypothetical protein
MITAMSKPIVLATVIFGALALLTVGLVIHSTMSSYEQLCEVCVTFRGQTQCREAYGGTPQEAVRTATDNACALLASGMTASIECSKTPPDRVTCEP